MKKILLCMIMGLSLVITACGNQTSNTVSEKNISNSEITTGAGKALIVYFAVAENSDVDASSSASVVTVDGVAKGRIRVLAEDIQNVTGGDLFSIQTSVVYPGKGEDLIEYGDQEQEDNARPRLTSYIENLDDYDVIFIGYPTWWYDLPMVMYSFFDEYNFSGKSIIPFNSHNGSQFSGTIGTIEELEPDAAVITNGFTVNERGVTDAAPDIEDWLKGLGY